ncbi:MAG: tyrosine--tRNA ligase, partial [Terriglobia bacterium]
FNLLVGRAIQQEYGQPAQIIMTMPILEGLEGAQKMSKSLGNYVGIQEPPATMFGKMMSISDTLMWRYYTLLTDLTPPQIAESQRSVEAGTAHPMELKKDLARRIVQDFHNETAAIQAQKSFESQFKEKGLPVEYEVVARSLRAQPLKLFQLLVSVGLFSSNSEAQRKIKEGAVWMSFCERGELGWKRMTNPTEEFRAADYGGKQVIFRAGRRMMGIVFQG